MTNIQHFSLELCETLFESMRDTPVSSGNPDTFNLFDHPIETFESLSKVANLFQNRKLVTLTDLKCKDVIPYILVDAIYRGRNTDLLEVKIESSRLQKVIATLGLPSLIAYCKPRDLTNIWASPVFYGRSLCRTAQGISKAEIHLEIWEATEGYIKSLNSWLLHHDVTMVKEFRTLMECLLTEVIENSNHGATKIPPADIQGDWALSGYMAKRGDEYVCYMSLITLGQSIFQSLQTTKNPVVISYLNKYLQHSNNNLTPEALLTAAATHDTVSSRTAAGGNGLTDFLHRFS